MTRTMLMIGLALFNCALAILPVQKASAATIFADSFDRGNSNNIDASLAGITDNTGDSLPIDGVYSTPWVDPANQTTGPDTTANNGGGQRINGNVYEKYNPGTANLFVNHNFINSSILAAGGFEHNQAMRDEYLPKPTRAEWTVTPPSNTGDAIRAGQSVGAQVALMDHAWWAPTVFVMGREKRRALFVERNLPGCVMVNRLGRRFVDEAAPYSEIVYAMYADNEKSNANMPAWLVFDSEFRRKYPCGPLLPGMVRPDKSLPAAWAGTVYFKAETLDALASQIEVDAKGLHATIERMNQYAASGDDEEFGKGSNNFDRYYGDVNVKPNPCLAPIAKPPFYAMRIDPGDIGTKGGLLTDEYARVLRDDGQPINGLYATGNTSAAVMGPSYPGAGSTLGPAMTFGYIAAHHLAGV